MAQRKLQLYLTEDQYRFLKQRAGEGGSMAAAVRELIDAAGRPARPTDDPFYRHIAADKAGSGKEYPAERAKRELYGRPR